MDLVWHDTENTSRMMLSSSSYILVYEHYRNNDYNWRTLLGRLKHPVIFIAEYKTRDEAKADIEGAFS